MPQAVKTITYGDRTFLVAGREEDAYFRHIEGQIPENAFYAALVESVELAADETAIDVGANIGLTVGIAASRSSNPIVAFEPGPAAFADLQRTVALNGFSNVRCEPAALSDGLSGGLLYEDYGNSSAAHLRAGSPAHELGPALATLDGFCAAEGIKPGLIKIDVEGFELVVLRGATRVLEQHAPILFVELNSFTTIAYGRVCPTELVKALKRDGYRLYWTGRTGVDEIASESDLIDFFHDHYSLKRGVDDLLAVPERRAVDLKAVAERFAGFRNVPSDHPAAADDAAILQDQLAAAQGALSAIQRSTTWRLTEPLRRLGALLKA